MCLSKPSTIWYYFSMFVCLQQSEISGDTIEFSAVSVNHTQCEDIENEEPPPLPPPRGESLKRPHLMETQSNPTSNHGTHVLHHEKLEESLIIGWFLVPTGMAFVVCARWGKDSDGQQRGRTSNMGCEQQEGRVMLGILHILRVLCVV
jgi:hypothetical protein